MATDITLARVVQAGAMPIDTYAVLAEIMSTWNRADAMEFATVMVGPYRAALPITDGEFRQGADGEQTGAKPS